MPELLTAARARGSELRIWSAGTSTGEEAYSLAIVCSELLRDHAGDVRVRIFATDADEQAIAFGRRGVYARDALGAVPAEVLERHFVHAGDGFEISKRIRTMMIFGQHDLSRRAPLPRIDLCVCRNLLSGLTDQLQKRALQLFAFALRDDGYLILGEAESAGALSDDFEVVDPALAIYRRRTNAELRRLNERLTIDAAETASANEDIETLNEEMQTTNEELAALNEELRATVEELNASNDELEARGDDLERLAEAREEQLGRIGSQRTALVKVLEAIAGSVVIVRVSDGAIMHAGTPLEVSDFAAMRGGWSSGSTVTSPKGTFTLTSAEVQVDGYLVFRLRRID